MNPPRADPFTRIVFAFGWECVGRWPRWATPVPKHFSSSSSSNHGQQYRPDSDAEIEVASFQHSEDDNDNESDPTLNALERYARTLVCNRFAPTWHEDEATYELARELALGQDNRTNPHGPVSMRLARFWGLWERMLAPWQMNQVVKGTGRVLALDLSDQMPMLGSMREIWRYGWFTDPSENALVKHLDIDLAHIREAADAGCKILRRRLEKGPAPMHAPYTPDELRDREDMPVERTVLGPVGLDRDKIFRPESLFRYPVPSHQDIQDLEKRLDLSAPLPDQYKAFFRVMDGMGPVWWNESQHLRILAPLSKVTIEDDELPPSMQLELLPSRGLADGTCISWPLLRRVICISEGGYNGDLWLVEPKYVAEAKEAFFQVYDHASEQDRRLLRRGVEEVYGSIDGFRKLDWGLLMWTSWFTEMVPYRDLSALMDELARGSRRTVKEWTLRFDPSTIRLNARFYKTANALDPSKEVDNVKDGKGNLVLSSPGTMAMGPLVYPENAMTMPMVDH
ncbi:hypothetical protein BDP55DRAFT_728640 [Colletotrichum godetiae]|uniref:Knr4/Smi1-like domain-containing protein n=1 Tax=Colletotrichum godetiae TaxID=1209918 RepID=A0AAJ0AL00_9PEZI|nr:uncharacterized protein BDP55DRAFT_728640 [Colletotrichum godetiae]KAK1675829.1 hypothetical protein BDP55DRAFT_728640 [Colletotrichum godetiae]